MTAAGFIHSDVCADKHSGFSLRGLGPLDAAASTVKEPTMRGVISNQHVRKNLGLIRREFGSGCLLRCLRAILTGERVTFLEVVFRHQGRGKVQT